MEHVTVKEAAEALQISEGLIRRACRQGRVPGAMLCGKSWTMPRESLTTWARRPTGRPRVTRPASVPEVVTAAQQIARIVAGKYSDPTILSDRQLRRGEEIERELGRILNDRQLRRGDGTEPERSERELTEEIAPLMTAALRKPNSGDEPRDTLSPAQIAALPKEVREARAAELAEQLKRWGVVIEAPTRERARLVTDKPASRLEDEPDPYDGPQLGKVASIATDLRLERWLQTDGYLANEPKRIGGLTIRKVSGLKELA